jgi:outer membrane protein OmpA-like peptidoglycan-associated protein
MAKCRPSKWVPWALLGAGLPLLCAGWLYSDSMEESVASRAGKALSGQAETAWAKVDINGRDLVIAGTAPSQAAIDLAVKTVAETDGVRTVKHVAQIVEPVKLVAPTVDAVNATVASPELKGSWQEGVATTLAVTVAGATYKLGENSELSSMGGIWTLKVPGPLAEGTYDVTAESSDGKETLAAAPGKLVVDLPDPVKAKILAAPTVMPYMGNNTKPTFTGTWPEAEAKAESQNLEVKVGDASYVLGKNPELTTDGNGNWSLASPVALPEGETKVMPSLLDAAGVALVSAAAPAMALVDITPPALPELVPVVPDTPWPYAITGKWPEAEGNTLTASLAGSSYTTGRNPELTSDGAGNFTFDPKVALAPGSYDIDFTVNDLAGNSAVKTMKAAIVIPEPVKIIPAEPAKVDAPTGAAWPYAVTGVWDAANGTGLTAKLLDRTYVLGRGMALTAGGDGKFSFAPSAKLAPGTYDVEFITTDKTDTPKVFVAKGAIVVPEPPPPPPPVVPADPNTVDVIAAGTPWPYPLTGVWDVKDGSTFSAKLQDRTYVLGRGAALTADAEGKFTFAPSMKLAPGVYDVEFTTTDKTETPKVVVAKGAIVVPEPAAPAAPAKVELPAPTVITQVDATGAPLIKGTWPNDLANALSVTVDGRTYELGKDANLSVKAGNWTLFPGSAMKNGVYEVAAVATAADGTSTADASANELTVEIPPPPPPPPPAATAEPYDCEAVITRITNVFPIRFEYDLTDITKPFDLSVSQYAALLKDPRCMTLNVELTGHADFRGSESYNQNLSERRAGLIRDMLKDAGVDVSRMSVKGMSELSPIDPATTDEARMKNRRVEITVKK